MKKILVLSLVLAIAMTSFAGTIKPQGVFPGDVYLALRNMQNAMLNTIMSEPNVVTTDRIGATMNVNSSINFVIEGLYRTALPVHMIVVSQDVTGLPTQNANTTKNYVFSVNKNGAVTCDVALHPYYPSVPVGFAPLFNLRVRTLAGGALRFGYSSQLAASANTTIEKMRTATKASYGVRLNDLTF